MKSRFIEDVLLIANIRNQTLTVPKKDLFFLWKLDFFKKDHLTEIKMQTKYSKDPL